MKNEDRNWNKPRDEDHSIAAAVFRAAAIRNEVAHHGDPESIDEEEFETIWRKIEEILADLQYKGDISDVKNGTFDPSSVEHLHSNMAKDFEKILLDYKEKCKKEKKDILKTFIKREFENESINDKVTYVETCLDDYEEKEDELKAFIRQKLEDKSINNQKIDTISTYLFNIRNGIPHEASCLNNYDEIMIDEIETYIDLISEDDDITTNLDQLLSYHDSVMVSGEAGMGRPSLQNIYDISGRRARF